MFCRKVLLPVEEGLYVVVLDGEDIGVMGEAGYGSGNFNKYVEEGKMLMPVVENVLI